MPSDDLLQYAHPAVLAELPPISPGADALEDWVAARVALVNVEEIDFLAAARSECECQGPDGSSCHLMEPEEQRRRTESIVEQNAEALRLFDSGIARGGLRLPVDPPDFDPEFISQTRDLVRLNVLRAEDELARGEIDSAVRTHLKNLEFGRRCMRGDGLIVDYLVGLAYAGVAIDGLAKISETHALSPASLEPVRDALDAFDPMAFLAHTLRSEFTRWTLPTIQHFEKMPDDAQLIERWFILVGGGHDEEDRAKFAWRHEQVLAACDGHPRIWDAAETVRCVSLHFARSIEEVENPRSVATFDGELQPWTLRRERFDAVWPPAFGGLVLPIPDSVDDLEPWIVDDWKRQITPLSYEELATLRIELRGVSNPLGMSLASNLEPGIGRASIERISTVRMSSQLRKRVDRQLRPSFGRRLRAMFGRAR